MTSGGHSPAHLGLGETEQAKAEFESALKRSFIHLLPFCKSSGNAPEKFRFVFLLEVITKLGSGSPQVIENFTYKETSKVFMGNTPGNFRATSSHGR